MGKEQQLKIWAARYGLIGDLVAALPILYYYENLHPGSFKYWPIHQKCAQAAPLFLNHPLINQIKITDGWVTDGRRDEELKATCSIVTKEPTHVVGDLVHWRNIMGVVDINAIMLGIDDLNDHTTPEQRIPKLARWFPSYTFSNNPDNHGYIDDVDATWPNHNNRIAIWPFAQYGQKPWRSPSEGWWNKMVYLLMQAGYSIHHYGWMTEPRLDGTAGSSNYHYNCHMSFFDQIRHALEATISLGTDSGSLWVLGAYGQPGIELMTYHEHLHTENPRALMPPYENHTMMFNDRTTQLGNDRIKHQEVMDELERKLH